MTLSDRELVFVIESENAMERYLEKHDQNPLDMDNRIWQIHFRATKRKQMSVLNSCFDHLLAKHKVLYSYMPHEMVTANVYKSLKVPYKWNQNFKSPKPDTSKNKNRRLDKFLRRYNSFPKSYAKVYAKMGAYAFDESVLRPLVKYSVFRGRQSLKSISDQLSSVTRTSSTDQFDPGAASTPKPISARKSTNGKKPFSNISNVFSSNNSEKSKSQGKPKNNEVENVRKTFTYRGQTAGHNAEPEIMKKSIKPAATISRPKTFIVQAEIHAEPNGSKVRPSRVSSALQTNSRKETRRFSSESIDNIVAETEWTSEPSATTRADVRGDEPWDHISSFESEISDHDKSSQDSTINVSLVKTSTKEQHTLLIRTIRKNKVKTPQKPITFTVQAEVHGEPSASKVRARAISSARLPTYSQEETRKLSSESIDSITPEKECNSGSSREENDERRDLIPNSKSAPTKANLTNEAIFNANRPEQDFDLIQTLEEIYESSSSSALSNRKRNSRNNSSAVLWPPLDILITSGRKSTPIENITQDGSNANQFEFSMTESIPQRVPSITELITNQGVRESEERFYENVNSPDFIKNLSEVTEQTVPMLPSRRSSDDFADDLFDPPVEKTLEIDELISILESADEADEKSAEIPGSNPKELKTTGCPTDDEEIPGSNPEEVGKSRTTCPDELSINACISKSVPFSNLGEKEASSPEMKEKLMASCESLVDGFTPERMERPTSPIISSCKSSRNKLIRKSKTKPCSFSQPVGKFVIHRNKNWKNSTLPKNFSSSCLNLDNKEEEEEDSTIFREPISQNASQSCKSRESDHSRRRIFSAPTKSIRTMSDCGFKSMKKASVVKSKKPVLVSTKIDDFESLSSKMNKDSNTSSEKPPVFRKLFTDEAVFRDAKRRTRKSKCKSGFLLTSSDTETFFTDHSSKTDTSYASAVPEFESIAAELNSINLATTSNEISQPSSFTMEGERPSQSPKNSLCSSSSKPLVFNSPTSIISQFSHSCHADDEGSSEQGLSDLDTPQFSYSPPSADEESYFSPIKRRSFNRQKPKSGKQLSTLSPTSSVRSLRSDVGTVPVNESLKFRKSPPVIAEEDDDNSRQLRSKKSSSNSKKPRNSQTSERNSLSSASAVRSLRSNSHRSVLEDKSPNFKKSSVTTEDKNDDSSKPSHSEEKPLDWKRPAKLRTTQSDCSSSANAVRSLRSNLQRSVDESLKSRKSPVIIAEKDNSPEFLQYKKKPLDLKKQTKSQSGRWSSSSSVSSVRSLRSNSRGSILIDENPNFKKFPVMAEKDNDDDGSSKLLQLQKKPLDPRNSHENDSLPTVSVKSLGSNSQRSVSVEKSPERGSPPVIAEEDVDNDSPLSMTSIDVAIDMLCTRGESSVSSPDTSCSESSKTRTSKFRSSPRWSDYSSSASSRRRSLHLKASKLRSRDETPEEFVLNNVESSDDPTVHCMLSSDVAIEQVRSPEMSRLQSSKSVSSTEWESSCDSPPSDESSQSRRKVSEKLVRSPGNSESVDKNGLITREASRKSSNSPSSSGSKLSRLSTFNPAISSPPTLRESDSRENFSPETRAREMDDDANARTHNASHVLDCPRNTSIDRQRYLDEYFNMSQRSSSFPATASQKADGVTSLSSRKPGMMSRSRENNLWYRSYHAESSNWSSDDEENSPPRSPIIDASKLMTVQTDEIEILGETRSPVASDASRQPTYRKRSYLSADDEYNSDALDILLDESLMKRKHFKKKSQQDAAEKPSEVDFTDKILEIFEKAKSEKNKRSQDSSVNKSPSSNSVSQSSGMATYQKALWDSMPSSEETASTTAEEKLRLTKEMFLKDSFENYTDSIDLSQFLESQQTEKDANYMSDDDFM